jgi:hypothetical protein
MAMADSPDLWDQKIRCKPFHHPFAALTEEHEGHEEIPSKDFWFKPDGDI